MRQEMAVSSDTLSISFGVKKGSVFEYIYFTIELLFIKGGMASQEQFHCCRWSIYKAIIFQPQELVFTDYDSLLNSCLVCAFLSLLASSYHHHIHYGQNRLKKVASFCLPCLNHTAIIIYKINLIFLMLLLNRII